MYLIIIFINFMRIVRPWTYNKLARYVIVHYSICDTILAIEAKVCIFQNRAIDTIILDLFSPNPIFLHYLVTKNMNICCLYFLMYFFVCYTLVFGLYNYVTLTALAFMVMEHIMSHLKEYYEIVDEARPLSGFFPTHADPFMEMHF